MVKNDKKVNKLSRTNGRLKTYTVKLNDLKKADYNPNTMEDRDFANLKKSIERYGYIEPIIVNRRNNVIIGGHHRYDALKLQGVEDVDIVYVDLDEAEEKRLNIALNRISGYWDIDKLEGIVNELMDYDPTLMEFTGLSEFELDSMFGVMEVDFLDEDNYVKDDETYVKTAKTPIYEITGDEPDIDELIDKNKSKELIKNINDAFENSKITEEQKKFLIYATTRHLVFNYANIAEYYAHQNKDMQELMEQSALIILDYNQAVKNGYLKLTSRVNELLELELENSDENE